MVELVLGQLEADKNIRKNKQKRTAFDQIHTDY